MTVALMTLAHAVHLGIDTDRMAAELERVSAPGCLWCTRRPAPYLVSGDRVCLGCYRAHRGEVTR